MELLRNLRFNGKRPTSIYYYRELQSLKTRSIFVTLSPDMYPVTVEAKSVYWRSPNVEIHDQNTLLMAPLNTLVGQSSRQGP